MQKSDWERIKHFRPDEKTPWLSPNAWGEPLKMNLAFMLLIDRMRDDLGVPVYVHCGTQGIHADKSLHPNGQAGDVSCPALGNPWNFFLVAIKYPFSQIGVYEVWNNKGLHLGYGAREGKKDLFAPKTLWHTELLENGNYRYHYF